MKAFVAAILGVVALSSVVASADEPLAIIAAPGTNSLVPTQWVQPDVDGNISVSVFAPNGRLAAAPGRVTLVGVDGRVLNSEADADGNFLLPSVLPGVYRLSYVSDEAYSTYALHIVEPREGLSLPSATSIVTSTLTPDRALMTIVRYQPVRIDRVPSIDVESDYPFPVDARRLNSFYQVIQNTGGGLDGRLFQAGSVDGGLVPAASVNVLIIQNGNVVGEAVTAMDGSFEVAALPPGIYDLIASGAAGFAAFGFDLLPSDEPLAGRAVNNPFGLASTTADDAVGGLPAPGSTAPKLETQLAPPTVDLFEEEEIAAGDEELPPLESLGPPLEPGFASGGFGGGGFGGGGMGGGGGGIGGGGGFGGFAALGGAIAAIAIAASDNDDDLDEDIASP